MKTPSNLVTTERRSANRTADNAGWESKVLGRLSGRLQERAADRAAKDEPTVGWESTVLDTLRRRIERAPK